MKVVHCLGWYLPDSSGGTENYVRALAREQRAQGLDVCVMAPRDGDEGACYEHEGVPVVRYPVPEARSRAQQEGLASHGRFDAFCVALQEEAPDVFHLHSLTYGAGPAHLRQARRLGARTVVTAHVPGFVCTRGTMMRMGREACDGRVDVEQCVPCWLQSKGLSQPLLTPAGALLRRVPFGVAGFLPGRAGTVLGSADRVRGQRATMRELAELADRTVAVCAWLRDALRDNGVPGSRLLLVRQAVDALLPASDRGPHLPEGDAGVPTLRIGYFGRAHPVKGLGLLVRAVHAASRQHAIALRIHALTGSEEERAHLREVRRLIGSDERIRVMAPVPPEQVVSTMRGCDLVDVPSRWLETGPMVAMDALAAGVPVLGSDLGGLRELVEPGVTGWLEPVDDLERWRARIETLAVPGAAKLSWSPEHPGLQTWPELAARMLDLYRELT